MRRNVISLLAMAAVLAAVPAWAQEAVVGVRGIRVGATGEARAVPDRAFLDFGVETQAATAKAAADENARRMERVLAALVGAGIPRADLQTREFSVFPVYELRPGEAGEPRITGYRVTNTVSIATNEVSRVGSVIDAALGAGANRGYGLRFGFRDPARVRAEALRDALTRARAEAAVIA
ncbi:MAG TPA: SIMPL domain-containing protein, partial [Longimicrobium sp.]|nr:SIMPL domain-containing protein [Longimicrobium sp.]